VRWLVASDELSAEQKNAIDKAVPELGLRNNSKSIIDEYDYIWVLGGARLSCLLRTRLACESIRGKKNPKAIILLASMRPIGDGERDATNTYAPNAETEFDLFIHAAKQVFNINDEFRGECHVDSENQNNSWAERIYQTDIGFDVIVLAAPSSEPNKRRANSADTYEFFFERFSIPASSSILLTTSQISVPYQQLEAIRTIALPHEIVLDTIGFPPEWGGDLQGLNEPSNYLQETRSAIQAINRFIDQYGHLN